MANERFNEYKLEEEEEQTRNQREQEKIVREWSDYYSVPRTRKARMPANTLALAVKTKGGTQAAFGYNTEKE